MPAAASSRSAVSSTTIASLPPISRIVRLSHFWPGCTGRRPLVDADAHFLAARERDEARQRMVDQHVADRAARTGQEVQHARRQVQLVDEELHQPGRDDRASRWPA